MHVLAALALLVAPPPPAASVTVASPNVVQVCSVARGECRTHEAAALDPTVGGVATAGQVAFVDPETGALVQPTLEQLDEVATPLAIVEESRVGARVDTVRKADGTVVATPRGGFLVSLTAVVTPASQPVTTAAPAAAAAEERP